MATLRLEFIKRHSREKIMGSNVECQIFGQYQTVGRVLTPAGQPKSAIIGAFFTALATAYRLSPYPRIWCSTVAFITYPYIEDKVLIFGGRVLRTNMAFELFYSYIIDSE